MAERPDGTLTVEDCEAISHADLAGARCRRPDRPRPITWKCRRRGSTVRWCAGRTSSAGPAMRPSWRRRSRSTGAAAGAVSSWALERDDRHLRLAELGAENGPRAARRTVRRTPRADGRAGGAVAEGGQEGGDELVAGRSLRPAVRRMVRPQGRNECPGSGRGRVGGDPERTRPARRVRPGVGRKPMAVSANKLELLQIADAVAREKQIDRAIVIEAMEDAIQKAARARYGQETEIRAEINPKSGETRLQRLLLVVEERGESGHADRARRCARQEPGRCRSATSSPIRCRPSSSAASPRSRPSR